MALRSFRRPPEGQGHREVCCPGAFPHPGIMAGRPLGVCVGEALSETSDHSMFLQMLCFQHMCLLGKDWKSCTAPHSKGSTSLQRIKQTLQCTMPNLASNNPQFCLLLGGKNGFGVGLMEVGKSHSVHTQRLSCPGKRT